MSNLIQFAQDELDRIAEGCKNDEEGYKIQLAINKNIMDIIKMFSEQGHSGTTAGYTISMLSRLLNYKPITSLTGEDDEWTKLDYNDRLAYQNKRCLSVFKDSQGRAYDTEAKVFSDDNGHTWYTSSDSSEYITFPYDVPDNPQSVLLDNSVAREEVKNTLKELIEQIRGTEIEQEFTEEDLLENYLSRDKWLDLQNRYVEKYKLTNLLQDIKYILNEDIYVWELINFIINSDKEEEK